MKTIHSSLKAQSISKQGLALTLGNYDGVHLGHQSILKKLNSIAKKKSLKSALYSFEPHPVAVLAPQIAPPLIHNLDQKKELLKSTKLDYLILEKFTKNFAKQSPEDFFKKILLQKLNTKYIIVGYDFTFGSKRSGNIETLEQLCLLNNVDVEIVDPFIKKETLVSSTLIRTLIQEGRLEEAKKYLSRPFFIDGTIIKGKQIGQSIGFPTANLKTVQQIIPASGVYATASFIQGQWHESITNIGTKPTVKGKHLSIETHIFNFKKKIYNKKLRLAFFKKLRDEICFKNLGALQKQIKKDCQVAQKYLKNKMKDCSQISK